MPRQESFADHLRLGVRWPETPSSEIPPMRPSRIGKTRFFSSKMDREILCDSGLEADFAAALDQLPEVLWYGEQPTPIGYKLHGDLHHYYPDFLVAFVDGRTVLVEVKINGYEFAKDVNVGKWAATIRYCRSAGRGFFIGNSRVSLAGALKWHSDEEVDRRYLPDLASTLGRGELNSLKDQLGKSNTEMAISLLKLGLIQDVATRAFRWATGPEQADVLEILEFFGSQGSDLRLRKITTSRSVAASNPTNVTSTLPLDMNTGKIWTADEEDRLLQLRRSGQSVASIAAQLGRRPPGIRARLRRLGYKI